MAVLIPRNGNPDLKAAVQRANESLAEFQRVRHWIVWPKSDFPRTTGTRKVIKGQVSEAVQTMVAQQQQTLAVAAGGPAPLSLPVINRITGTNAGGLNLSAKLADDLKLDSLGRVELLSALEDQYQIEIDEAAITEATTIGDVEKIVSQVTSEAAAYPYPRWTMRFPMTWIRPVVYHLFLLPLSRIMCTPRVIGAEHLAKVNGPALLISNHVTHIDGPLILSVLPLRWRLGLAIAMSGEYLRDWRYPPATLGWFPRLKARMAYVLGAGLFHVFSLPRQSGFRQSFAYTGEAMDRGYSVLIFPEGTETKDGHIQPFRAGIGLLASELECSGDSRQAAWAFRVKKEAPILRSPRNRFRNFWKTDHFRARNTTGGDHKSIRQDLQDFAGFTRFLNPVNPEKSSKSCKRVLRQLVNLYRLLSTLNLHLPHRHRFVIAADRLPNDLGNQQLRIEILVQLLNPRREIHIVHPTRLAAPL